MMQVFLDQDFVLHITKWPHIGASLMVAREDITAFSKILEESVDKARTSVSFQFEFKRSPITKGGQTRRLERIIIKKPEHSSLVEINGGVIFSFSIRELERLQTFLVTLGNQLDIYQSSELRDYIQFHREEKRPNAIMTLILRKDKTVTFDLKEFCYLVLALWEASSSLVSYYEILLESENSIFWINRAFGSLDIGLMEIIGEEKKQVVYELSGLNFLTFYLLIYHQHSLLISEMANNPEITMEVVKTELDRSIVQEGRRGAKVRRLRQVHKSLIQRLHQKKPTRRRELQQIILTQRSLGVEILSSIIEKIWSNNHT